MKGIKYRNNQLELNTFRSNIRPLDIFDTLDVSKNTKKEYKRRIELFLSFIEKNQLNINSFLNFKQYLKSRNDLTVSTKNKYLITAKVFLKELNRQSILPYDLTQNIKTFTQSKKHKKEGINQEELEKVIVAIQDLDNTPTNIRLKAIFSLLIFQGLRQIEIYRIDVKDIDLINKIVFIQGKGKDDKEPVNLHPKTVIALRRYIQACNIKDGALFVSNSNNHKNCRLSTKSIRYIVKSFLKDLNIKKSTHGFRHFFVTKLVQNYNGDLLRISQYTRHKSLEMLQVYNDAVKTKEDLPKFYKVFDGINL